MVKILLDYKAHNYFSILSAFYIAKNMEVKNQTVFELTIL